MLAINVIFDGKVFVPQQPVTLLDQSEALVMIDQVDPAAQAKLDADVRAYFQGVPDADDDAWANAVGPQSHHG